ncbi:MULTISPECIES: hypothetical protein [Paenibacillus]|uniref:hypothetical protein n=1 Tax=Paenibacillus TaxID=44249 RepID=UPI0009A7A8E1|nr:MULTISPECIES: hypothetical protein [Paenibacillus]MCZ1267414.1 hypothetical protein [Paenibacillus tundrae]SLK16764.1 hypothetical protein SAMN06272722_110243 [Paenibacillus sp. RU5A]SOC74459.1 hypothetical protein SAMN05880581_110243 [Paenibacillus sp. RU26A]SOC76648.1 hypothetical protein SAMN05880586_110243 [Paenibacillus sp. RU5M]
MSEFSILKKVFHVINTTAIANRNEFKSLEYHRREIAESMKQLLLDIKDKQINFELSTRGELENLGFTFRRADNGASMMLIPLYILSVIPEGTEIINFNGSKLYIGIDHLDDDHRGGYLSYGIELKDT